MLTSQKVRAHRRSRVSHQTRFVINLCMGAYGILHQFRLVLARSSRRLTGRADSTVTPPYRRELCESPHRYLDASATQPSLYIESAETKRSQKTMKTQYILFIYNSYIYFLTVLRIDDRQSLLGIQPVTTFQ